MASRTVSLNVLARRISKQQSELNMLQREYANRKAALDQLRQQKRELEKRLKSIESDMKAVRRGRKPKYTTVPALEGAAATAVAEAPRRRRGRPRKHPVPTTAEAPIKRPRGRPRKITGTLSDQILQLLQRAGGPMTASQLSKELIRMKFPTKSQNLANLVQARMNDLLKKGLVRKAENQPGVVLASGVAANGQPPRASGRRGRPPGRRGPRATGQPSLAKMIVSVLEKSSRPMKGRELAERVLAAGYKTTSKNPAALMWAVLNRLPNVENVPGQGYRLKR